MYSVENCRNLCLEHSLLQFKSECRFLVTFCSGHYHRDRWPLPLGVASISPSQWGEHPRQNVILHTPTGRDLLLVTLFGTQEIYVLLTFNLQGYALWVRSVVISQFNWAYGIVSRKNDI